MKSAICLNFALPRVVVDAFDFFLLPVDRYEAGSTLQLVFGVPVSGEWELMLSA